MKSTDLTKITEKTCLSVKSLFRICVVSTGRMRGRRGTGKSQAEASSPPFYINKIGFRTFLFKILFYITQVIVLHKRNIFRNLSIQGIVLHKGNKFQNISIQDIVLHKWNIFLNISIHKILFYINKIYFKTFQKPGTGS